MSRGKNGGDRNTVKEVLTSILERHGLNLRTVARDTGIDPGTMSRIVNDCLGYKISREQIGRITGAIKGITRREVDDLHRAVGHIPTDLEEAFVARFTTARLLRAVTELSLQKQRDLLAKLGGE